MPDGQSVLTPPAGQGRPAGTGWVAYHAMSADSAPALGMTWREHDGRLRWAAVVDRIHDGCVAFWGTLDEDGDVRDALRIALRSVNPYRSLSDGHVLALMLPNAAKPAMVADGSGLPDVEAHAQLARRALAEAPLRSDMRAALTDCLVLGSPRDMPRNHWRKAGERGDWGTLSLSTRHPAVVRHLMRSDPKALIGGDPIGAFRRKWRHLSDAHFRRIEQLGDFNGSRLLAGDSETSGDVLRLLSSIPADWFPAIPDIDGFRAAAGAVARLGPTCGHDPAPMLAGAKGDWGAFSARMYRSAGIHEARLGADAPARLADAAKDCEDALDALADGLIVPLVASHADEAGVRRIEQHQARLPPYPEWWLEAHDRKAWRKAAAELLYAGKSAPAVLETSRRWHAMQAGMAANFRRDEGERGWPPLFEGEFRFEDVSVVAIRSYAALRDEGALGPDADGVQGLDHCVLSRLPRYLSGASHVLSVRQHEADGTWRRLSTCEVHFEEPPFQPPALKVVEHRGASNAFPPGPASRAIAKFMGAVRERRIRFEPEALAERAPAEGDAISRKCGYDWRDPRMLAIAVEAWDPLLPRWARGLGPDGLMDALVERGLAVASSPDGCGMRP